MWTPSNLRGKHVCGVQLGDLEAWLRLYGRLIFETWSDEKLLRWILHHGTNDRLAVLFKPGAWDVIRGVAMWQRIPNDLDVSEGMAWGWHDDASFGHRIYVSVLVGDKVPLIVFARLIHDVMLSRGASKVVCHRRNKVRDLTDVFERLKNGVTKT